MCRELIQMLGIKKKKKREQELFIFTFNLLRMFLQIKVIVFI